MEGDKIIIEAKGFISSHQDVFCPGKIKIISVILLLIINTNFSPGREERKEDFKELLKTCEISMDTGEYDEALECYKKAISIKPKYKGIHEAMGYIYFKKGEYDKAMKEFQEEIKLDEDNLPSKFLLGLTYLLKDEIEKAHFHLIELKSEVEKRRFTPQFFLENPGLIDFSLGIVWKKEKFLEGAEQAFQIALIKGYPKIDCLINLFELYLQKNETEKAEEILKELQNLREVEEDQIGSFEDILLTKDRKGLEKFTDKIKIWYYKNPITALLDIMNKKALSFIERGDIMKGIEMWKRALEVNRKSFHINYNLSLVLFDIGNLEESRIYCKKAILSGDPEHIHWAYNLMGNIFYAQKNYVEAINFYKKSVEIAPQFSVGHYNLGSVYDTLGDEEKAEKHWRLAVQYGGIRGKGRESEERLKEGKIEILVYVEEKRAEFLARKSLGFLYEKKGLKDKAIEEFESALEIIPTDPEIHYELGLIYMGLKNREKAIYHLENAIKNGTKKEREARAFLMELRKNE